MGRKRFVACFLFMFFAGIAPLFFFLDGVILKSRKTMSSLHEQGTQRLKRATQLDREGRYEEAVPEYITALEYFLAELKYEKRFGVPKQTRCADSCNGDMDA